MIHKSRHTRTISDHIPTSNTRTVIPKTGSPEWREHAARVQAGYAAQFEKLRIEQANDPKYRQQRERMARGELEMIDRIIAHQEQKRSDVKAKYADVLG